MKLQIYPELAKDMIIRMVNATRLANRTNRTNRRARTPSSVRGGTFVFEENLVVQGRIGALILTLSVSGVFKGGRQ